MAKTKTASTNESVTGFINLVKDDRKRKDSFEMVKIFEKETGFKAKMWGPSIVGFGNYHYKYESGHEGDAPLAGFSPRTAAFSLYLMGDFKDRDKLLSRLGKHKESKACVYFKKLEDIDTGVMMKLVHGSMDAIKKLYP